MNQPRAPGPPAPLVLLIEDEPAVRRYLKAGLTSQGYRYLEAATGAEGARLAAQHVPDVILLDLGLPDRDGMEVLREIRQWSAIPVVVLTARDQESQKVAALDAGADDYLTKPFGFGELLARLRAVQRRAAAPRAAAGRLECGPLVLDVEKRQVQVSGREVHLTPIEFRLLITLARHPDRVITRRQLIQAVWGPHPTDAAPSLRVHMAHLRRKIEDEGGAPRMLVTEAGVGYRLVPPGETPAGG